MKICNVKEIVHIYLRGVLIIQPNRFKILIYCNRNYNCHLSPLTYSTSLSICHCIHVFYSSNECYNLSLDTFFKNSDLFAFILFQFTFTFQNWQKSHRERSCAYRGSLRLQEGACRLIHVTEIGHCEITRCAGVQSMSDSSRNQVFSYQLFRLA